MCYTASMASKQIGDPDGRRPARSRSVVLGQANRLAQSLLAILERAGLDVSLCEDLLQKITQAEQTSLLRAYGRIEPRKRFKGHSAQLLSDGRSLNFIFLDESGKSFPEAGDLPQFFAVGAVAFKNEQDQESYCQKADAIKQEFFGTTEMTFHQPMMKNHEGPYYLEGNTVRQAEFDAALEGLIKDSNFAVFGAGVRKQAFRDEFLARIHRRRASG